MLQSIRGVFMSAVIAGLFVFVVVPLLPNVVGGDDAFSLTALTTFAQDGGDGDGGGDAGGGCGCDGGDTGGGDTGGGDYGGGNDYPVPVCSLRAHNASITSGNTTTLVWDTSDAAEVTLDNGIGRVSIDGSRTVAPTANTTYTLTALGLGGTSVTCTASVAVTPVVVPGQCILEITKSTDKMSASIGESLTYTLNFRNVGTANCTGGGVRIVDDLPAEVEYLLAVPSANVTGGYQSLPLYDSVRHTVNLNADVLTPGESGSATIKVRVLPRTQCGAYNIENKAMITAAEYSNATRWVESNVVRTAVQNACPQPVPVCTLDANTTSIVRGQSATLTWTTQNATSVSIAGGASSNEVASGFVIVSPIATQTYVLTATGAGGSVTCSRTITVTEPTPDPVLSCDSLTATPSVIPTSSGSTTLTWATTNATAVSISNGIGNVAVDGSREVFVNANTTFTLTATRGSETRTCTVPVTVTPPLPVPRCDSFTVNDASVSSGTDVTLAWETTNATQVSIDNGVGNVSVDGSQVRNIENDSTFTLTASNGSTSVTCQVSVDVESSGGGGGGGGSSAPRCSLKASDTKVKAGEKVTLSWKNTRTNEIILKDDRGNELIDTEGADDEKEYNEDEDTIDVRPTKTTTYTLIAFKGSKKRTCTVEVAVEKITVSSTRSNTPLVAGISLSRLPYTGFDAGPFLTAVFYTLLVVWALAVAYFLVIRRESVLGISLREKTVGGSRLIEPLITDPKVVVPTMVTPRITAPEVSRMGYVPSLLARPRAIPHGDMASKAAPVGYEAYYEGYGETIPSPIMVAEEIPNLPIEIESVSDMSSQETADIELLEARAHDAHVLISTDALNFVMAQSQMTSERVALLDVVVGAAKAHFPKEDGWVVVNKDRIIELLK